MYLIQDVLVADEVLSSFFVCQLDKCKGACCVEGDFGAPLDEPEIAVLQKIYPQVKPFLDKEGVAAIDQKGVFEVFQQEEISFPGTTLRSDGACAFVKTDNQGMVSCGIELAQRAGVISERKPISCHLYPLRYSEIAPSGFKALNYDRWDICHPACQLGDTLKVPLISFLREAIVRRFGISFYEELMAAYEHKLQNQYNPTE